MVKKYSDEDLAAANARVMADIEHTSGMPEMGLDMAKRMLNNIVAPGVPFCRMYVGDASSTGGGDKDRRFETGQTDGQTYRDRKTQRQTQRQTNRHRQTYRQTDDQTDRDRDRDRERETIEIETVSETET